MARIGTDAWFGEIESWLRELLARLPQGHETERDDLVALISEIHEVRVISGRVRVGRRLTDPI